VVVTRPVGDQGRQPPARYTKKHILYREIRPLLGTEIYEHRHPPALGGSNRGETTLRLCAICGWIS
jgi:hypothetical protein